MKQSAFHLFGDTSLPAMRLGESALWDERLQKFYWVDIDGRRVYRGDSNGGQVEYREIQGRPGCVGLTSDVDVIVVAVEQSVMTLSWQTESLANFVDIKGKTTHVRLNDGKVDRFGRFWVGSMHSPSSDGRRDGELVRIDHEGSVRKVKQDVGVANGLAFTWDGRYGFFADSPTRRVLRFEFRDSAFDPTTEKVFFDFDSVGLEGKPDGACVDTDGCYWVACGYGSSVARIDPKGRLDRLVPVPVKRPTCCAFGGPNLDRLFVTSIGAGLGADPLILPEDSWAGRPIFADLGYQGTSEAVFSI